MSNSNVYFVKKIIQEIVNKWKKKTKNIVSDVSLPPHECVLYVCMIVYTSDWNIILTYTYTHNDNSNKNTEQTKDHVLLFASENTYSHNWKVDDSQLIDSICTPKRAFEFGCVNRKF